MSYKFTPQIPINQNINNRITEPDYKNSKKYNSYQKT